MPLWADSGTVLQPQMDCAPVYNFGQTVALAIKAERNKVPQSALWADCGTLLQPQMDCAPVYDFVFGRAAARHLVSITLMLARGGEGAKAPGPPCSPLPDTVLLPTCYYLCHDVLCVFGVPHLARTGGQEKMALRA